jgi:TRAP-type mannitol/chloroaromatic compound transport system permease large subunit
MDPLTIDIIVAVFTLIVLFSGIPIAFGLSFVSITLLVTFEGLQMLDVFAETFYAGLNSFVLLSIPMFILMGMAVAHSPAGKDLYTGLDRWLWRVPGGLVISNIGACSIFAALSGSRKNYSCDHRPWHGGSDASQCHWPCVNPEPGWTITTA